MRRLSIPATPQDPMAGAIAALQGAAEGWQQVGQAQQQQQDRSWQQEQRSMQRQEAQGKLFDQGQARLREDAKLAYQSGDLASIPAVHQRENALRGQHGMQALPDLPDALPGPWAPTPTGRSASLDTPAFRKAARVYAGIQAPKPIEVNRGQTMIFPSEDGRGVESVYTAPDPQGDFDRAYKRAQLRLDQQRMGLEGERLDEAVRHNRAGESAAAAGASYRNEGRALQVKGAVERAVLARLQQEGLTPPSKWNPTAAAERARQQAATQWRALGEIGQMAYIKSKATKQVPGFWGMSEASTGVTPDQAMAAYLDEAAKGFLEQDKAAATEAAKVWRTRAAELRKEIQQEYGASPAGGAPVAPAADGKRGAHGLIPTWEGLLLEAQKVAPGAPVTSTGRSAAGNASIGGAQGSFHTRGQGIDIVPRTPQERQALIDWGVSRGLTVLEEGDGAPHSTGYHLHFQPTSNGRPQHVEQGRIPASMRVRVAKNGQSSRVDALLNKYSTQEGR